MTHFQKSAACQVYYETNLELTCEKLCQFQAKLLRFKYVLQILKSQLHKQYTTRNKCKADVWAFVFYLPCAGGRKYSLLLRIVYVCMCVCVCKFVCV